jgi:WXG100 family type VII secretion target
MSEIRINTGDVTRIGGDFGKMSDEVDSLVSRAKGMMGNLQPQFTGGRSKRIFDQWDQMAPSLQSAIETLRSAGALLSSASKDFSDADMR